MIFYEHSNVITQWEKSPKKESEEVPFCQFGTQNIVRYGQNTLLQTAFSAILPTGMRTRNIF